MRKWTVYISLVACLSGCGRGNGNNQNDSSAERVDNNVPVEAIKVEKQNNYESREPQDIINTRKMSLIMKKLFSLSHPKLNFLIM